METKFTISTNIVRDANQELDYILTPNAKDIFNRIIADYKTGHHSFNIIGSYGTGKSSFLWAFEKNLNGQPIFEPLNGQFGGLKEFEFLKLIGEASSFKSSFANKIKASNEDEIFNKLESLYKSYQKQSKVLIILVDEFGKFLEYAAKHNPEEELYFIQQLAEFANDHDKNILFITTLHQNFSNYSRILTTEQKAEWEKVKGRLTDLAFDEPIEQLLFFAAERLDQRKKRLTKNFDQLFKLIKESKLIPNAPNLNPDLAKKLEPLDYLSAYILTSALQKYGQNERSLFTFLASTDKFGINEFQGEHYGVTEVFDYLVRNLASELNNPANPHKSQWKETYTALDKAEAIFEKDFKTASQIIKVICLVNIFGKKYGSLNEGILLDYLKLTSGIKNAGGVLDKLVAHKIIKFYNYRNKFHFLDGTDADLEQELLNAGKNISFDFDLTGQLHRLFQFTVIPAKRYQYETGTPRFFEYRLADELSIIEPTGEIDGHINLIFSEEKLKTKLLEFSKENNQAQIFVWYKNTLDIRNEVFEILKYDYVISSLEEDKTAKNILLEERQVHVNKLNTMVLENLFSDNNDVLWLYNGKEEKIRSKAKLNQWLSAICKKTYPESPILRNELINREQLSTPILTARKALIKDIFEHIEEENLGYTEDKFPPQKTIYLSLLKETGVHRKENDLWGLYKPTKDINSLWETGEDFLGSAKSKKQNLSGLYEKLKQTPIKVKRGIAEFWVPIFLIAKKEDFALFHVDTGYVPFLNPNTLDLIHKSPSKFEIQTYDISGVNLSLFNKYDELVNLADKKRGTGSKFIALYSQFFRFYNELPNYTRKTKKLNPKTRGFRDAIPNAKDPHDALFVKFPLAMKLHKIDGKTTEEELEAYGKHLQESIKELRTAFHELFGRIEQRLLKDLGWEGLTFEEYQPKIIQRYKTLNKDLLTHNQKTFCTRLMAPLDDRISWLKSIIDPILGKDSEKMLDSEEELVMQGIQEMLHDLDQLIPIHKLRNEYKSDEVIGVEMIGADGKARKEQLIVTKETKKDANALKKEIEELLKNRSREVSKTALFDLLNEKLKKKNS